MSDFFLPIIGADYPTRVIPIIEGAKKNIDLIFYDWRWYPNQPTHAVQRFNLALVRARSRGVQIRAILNTDLILPTLKKVGIQARILRDKRTVHTKLLIVDDSILVIGSHNITRNAFSHNLETSLAVSIPSGVTRYQEFFNNLFQI